MGKFLLALIALAVGAVAVGAYYLSNTDNLRAPLETYLSDKTGLPVKLQGELSWQLFPPLQLKVTGLTAGAKPDGTRYPRYGTLKSVNLKVAPLTVLRAPNDPKRWTINAFTLDDLTYRDGNQYWALNRFGVSNLTDNTLAPFHTSLRFGKHLGTDGDGDDEDPFEESVALDGQIKFSSADRSLELKQLHIDGTMAVGVCDAQIALVPTAGAPYRQLNGNPILPVNDLRDTTWVADCQLDSVTWLGERFESVQWQSNNTQGLTQHQLEVADAFGGAGQIRANIDATGNPVTWDIQPMLAGIQIERLFSWLRQDTGWRGPLDLDAKLKFRGNHRAALVDSAQGEVNVASVNGYLDIKKIKDQAQSLSQYLGKSETVSRWPDELNYQSLSAQWLIDGEQHQLAALLDNVQFNAQARYNVANDKLRLKADLQFLATAEVKPLPINPMLENLAIPFECKGTLRKPDCGIDSSAGARLIGDILAGRTGGDENQPALRDKIERTIEEEVPEAWQDAARSLLDLLGDSLGK